MAPQVDLAQTSAWPMAGGLEVQRKNGSKEKI